MTNSNTKKALTWSDVYKIGSCDRARRYTPHDAVAVEYINLNSYRSPSAAWPWSYAKALLTQKFAKWARENHPEFAEAFEIA